MRWSNLLLLWVSCGLVGTGLVMAYRLPSGSKGGRGLEVLGYSRHDWGELHLWLAYGVLALMAVHLALNWPWLRRVAAKARWWPLAVGLGVGLLLAVGPLALPVTRGERESRGDRHEAGKAEEAGEREGAERKQGRRHRGGRQGESRQGEAGTTAPVVGEAGATDAAPKE